MDVVSSGGVTLPDDAAPLDQQMFRSAAIEGKHFDTMRNEYEGFAYEATIEQLAKMGPEGEWHPAAADSWELSEGWPHVDLPPAPGCQVERRRACHRG